MAAMPDMSGDIAPNANEVPNFPQDAYMEGPRMMMDQAVERPENFGLRPGWSGFMQGMMTFVRVLEPDKYDEVISRMRQAKRANDPYAAILGRTSGARA
jgi:manganese oxidase